MHRSSCGGALSFSPTTSPKEPPRSSLQAGHSLSFYGARAVDALVFPHLAKIELIEALHLCGGCTLHGDQLGHKLLADSTLGEDEVPEHLVLLLEQGLQVC